jgi:2-keto-3-deoxy-6-phosphogluconate aldolase
VDFILILTRRDRTVEDAEDVVDAVAEIGVRHIGFKDIGVPRETLARVAARVRSHNGVCYLEVVSTTPEAVTESISAGAALGVDCILGGTDLAAARRVLGSCERYFPFPGRPLGHPTRLVGSAAEIEDDARRAREHGCGGIDLLAYRATDADPLALVRAARRGVGDGRLIVAGSVQSTAQIHALAEAGADAFTIGSAVFDGSFSPTKGSLRGQILDVLHACRTAPAMAG